MHKKILSDTHDCLVMQNLDRIALSNSITIFHATDRIGAEKGEGVSTFWVELLHLLSMELLRSYLVHIVNNFFQEVEFFRK